MPTPSSFDPSNGAHAPLVVRVAEIPEEHAASRLALTDLLPDPRDPVAWIGGRFDMVGWGRALTLEAAGRHAARDAARAWNEVRRDARVDAPEGAPTLPIALGSFGFSRETPGMLIVPAALVLEERNEGTGWGGTSTGQEPRGRRRRWVATAARSSRGTEPEDPMSTLDAALAARSSAPVRAPHDLRTRTGLMTQSEWADSVRRLIARLKDGTASKVVMSRDMIVESDEPIDERFLLARLHEFYPTTWAYAVGGLVGATPEMLASMEGGRVRSRVLAGTSGPGGGAALMESMKDRTEHLLAVESVARALAPIAETLDVPERPRILDLPNVSHLATDVTATLPGAGVLDVIDALHPTAAVCGTPTALAFDLLEDFESTQRGRYSGPVGWVDAVGEGEFGIGLRCGQVSEDGREVRVFAGGGIMPDSIPEVELAETRAKMAPVLQALGVTVAE